MRMSPFDQRSPGPGGILLASAAQAGDSMPDSEAALRNLKASESAQLAFAASGIPNPSPALVNMVSDFVRQKTLGIPAGQMAAMAPGSGELAASAATGVNMAVGAMSDEQRDAVRNGSHNALSAADIARIHAVLNSGGVGTLDAHRNLPGNGERAAGGREGTPGSSASYDSIPPRNSPEYYTTPRGQAEMRSYATSLGLGWATGNREVLSLGPAALETFAKVQMQKETYEKLTKGIGLDAKDAPREVEYYLKNGGDPAKHKEHVDNLERNIKGLTQGDPNAARIMRDAMRDLVRSKGGEADKRRFNDSVDGIVRDNPDRKKFGDEIKREMKTQEDKTIRAEQKADAGAQVAAAEKKGAEAAKQGAEAKEKKDDEKTAERASKFAAFKNKASADDSASPKPEKPESKGPPKQKLASANPH